MKTSFYFILWILIYPILGLLNNSFINNNTFVVALAAVLGISWLLEQTMSKTNTYGRASQISPILEDVYTCNVESFRKRLTRKVMIETITAIYFMVTVAVILLAILKFGINDWVALIVFGFLTFRSINLSAKLMKAKSELKSNPTSEQCMVIADDTYGLDYTSYYEAHENQTYHDMLPKRPAHYKAFQIISIVLAATCALLGLLFILSGIAFMIIEKSSVEVGALSVLNVLYGSLAIYFGVKDAVSIWPTLKKGAFKQVPINTTESFSKNNQQI